MKNNYLKNRDISTISNVLVVYPFTYQNPYYAMPPMATEYGAAALINLGKKVTLLDFRFEKDLAEHADLICQVDLICLFGHSEYSPLWGHYEENVVSEILAMTPESTPVIAGGMGFLNAEETLKQHGKIDLIIQGTPEYPLREIFTDGKFFEISNLIFRDGNKIHKTLRKTHPLDNSLFPDRKNRNKKYEYQMMGIPMDIVRTGSGCNYRCTFCYEFGKDYDGSFLRWQGRSAKSLFLEIQNIPAQIVALYDDDITTNMETLSQLSDFLIRSKIRKMYAGAGRIDHIVKSDPEILRKMERAGFLALSLGIESVQEKTLKLYKKGLNLKIIEAGMRRMNQSNIILACTFLMGSPGETESDMLDILRFGRKWNIDSIGTNTLRISDNFGLYSAVHDTDGKVKPGYERIEGDELWQIKCKIKYGQRTPFRIWLLILKMYKHRGMVMDPTYFLLCVIERVTRFTWFEKSYVLPLFVKLLKVIFSFRVTREMNRGIAYLLYPVAKGMNAIFEYFDRNLTISTKWLPRFFLFLRNGMYEKQRRKTQILKREVGAYQNNA